VVQKVRGHAWAVPVGQHVGTRAHFRHAQRGRILRDRVVVVDAGSIPSEAEARGHDGECHQE